MKRRLSKTDVTPPRIAGSIISKCSRSVNHSTLALQFLSDASLAILGRVKKCIQSGLYVSKLICRWNLQTHASSAQSSFNHES